MNKKTRTIVIIILLLLAAFYLFGPKQGTEAPQAVEPASQAVTVPQEDSSGQTLADLGPVEEAPAQEVEAPSEPEEPEENILEDGFYTSKEDVALYIHTFGHLPDNFLTKDEAEDLGWVSTKGNLWKVTDHMSIGGDYFGNYEKKLPQQKGRKYYECDINYNGGTRGAERIIFSNDGLIFYTEDHYNTFEQLY